MDPWKLFAKFLEVVLRFSAEVPLDVIKSSFAGFVLEAEVLLFREELEKRCFRDLSNFGGDDSGPVAGARSRSILVSLWKKVLVSVQRGNLMLLRFVCGVAASVANVAGVVRYVLHGVVCQPRHGVESMS